MKLDLQATREHILEQLRMEIVLRLPVKQREWVGMVIIPNHRTAPRIAIMGDRHHSIRTLVVDTVTQCLGNTPLTYDINGGKMLDKNVFHEFSGSSVVRWGVPMLLYYVTYFESTWYSHTTELAIL